MDKDINKHQDDRYFRLTNFYTAAFLFAKGLELVNIDRTSDPKRAEFVFIDTPNREELIRLFNFGLEDDPNLLLDARKFIFSIKTLKDKLYQSNF